MDNGIIDEFIIKPADAGLMEHDFNLIKGGSLDNAIVVQGSKILNEDGLRNRNEFVHHKILDCLGDIMLSGNRIFGHIKTSQGGHALTNRLLTKFFSDKANWKLENFENIENQNENSYKNPVWRYLRPGHQ